MDSEKQAIIKKLKLLLRKGFLKSTRKVPPQCSDLKLDQKSEEFREEGNVLYQSKNHDIAKHKEILVLYNKSIAFASRDSETLAKAYANKSLLLRHVCRYSEGNFEIDRALKITKSNSLKIKLLCRKAQSLTALNSMENMKNLEKAKFILSKLGESEEAEDALRMITATETYIRNTFCRTTKKDKLKVSKSKMIKDIKNIEASNLTEVQYSKKFGVHLVAAQNFRPGELIMVEKPFCAVANARNYIAFLYCSHCSKYLWTAVPCDCCTWCMFCSEKCKSQAWEEYHRVECQVMSSLLNIDLFDAYPYPQLSLRVFLITLFKVGSIAQFRTNLQAIIAGKGQYETLCTDGKLESYKYFYSLFGNATPDEYNEITEVSAIILINLAKNSTIFGTNYDFDEVDLLTKNDDAMFVGAVLVKTWKTCLLNNTLSFVANPNCKTPNFLGQCLNGSCCGRSGFITPKASSIVYSCCPNVARSSTSNNTMVVYAIKPIEKGEKLYHGIYSIYNYAPKTERQKLFRKRYGFDCDCQACKYNWTERSFTDDIPREFSFEVNTALCDVMHFTQNFSKEDTSGDEIAVKFQECVEILWRYLQLPSMHLISTVKALVTIIQHLHYGLYSEKFEKCSI